MADAVGLSEVVGLIYDAALDPELWPAVLEQVTDLLGGHFGVFIQPPGGAMVTVRQDPPLYGAYVEHFREKDLLVREVSRLAAGTVVTDRMVVPRDAFERSEYYNDFLRPQQAEEGIAAVFSLATSGLSIWRSPTQGQWDVEQIDVLRHLTPHFRRAMEIGRRLENAEPRRAGSVGLLDSLPHAAFLVAAGGRIVFANSAAETLLAEADGLRFVSGYLCATTTDHTARLSSAVARAAGEAPGNVGDAVSLPRRPPRRSLLALVAPLAPAIDWAILPRPPRSSWLSIPDRRASPLQTRFP